MPKTAKHKSCLRCLSCGVVDRAVAGGAEIFSSQLGLQLRQNENTLSIFCRAGGPGQGQFLGCKL